MPPRVYPRRPGDRHLPRGCKEIPGGQVRVPESLKLRFVHLMRILGPGAGHAAVFRFLFETARVRIDQMTKEMESRDAVTDVVPKKEDVEVMDVVEGHVEFAASEDVPHTLCLVTTEVPDVVTRSSSTVLDTQNRQLEKE